MFDVIDSLRQTYGGLNEVVKNVIEILTMSPESNQAVFSMVRRVYELLLPMGYSLATIFILITFVDQAMLFKLNNYERIVKLFLVFTIGKVILENSFDILAWIYSIFADLIMSVSDDPAPMDSLVDMSALEAQVSQMSFMDKFFFWAQSSPITALVNVINFTVKAIAYGRIFELYVYMSLAPLPLSTAVSEDHRGISKSFFQSYIGVCVQGFIMLFCCLIYTALAIQFKDPTQQDSMMGGFGGYLAASMVLLFVLTKSGSWAKEMVGLR